MKCKCGGTLVRFYFCDRLGVTLAACEACARWSQLRRESDRIEASPAEPPKQETWRDRPPML